MFSIEGTKISLSRGDTGSFTITAEGYEFAEEDRALFSVKSVSGAIVIQRVYELTDGAFRVDFYNQDTDTLSPGAYTWDVRYVIHPYYDGEGTIVNGDQVITPNQPMNMTLLAVVGNV